MFTEGEEVATHLDNLNMVTMNVEKVKEGKGLFLRLKVYSSRLDWILFSVSFKYVCSFLPWLGK